MLASHSLSFLSLLERTWHHLQFLYDRVDMSDGLNKNVAVSENNKKSMPTYMLLTRYV